MINGKFITLGIESSCDETSVAVVSEGRQILSNIIASQIKIHEIFGGVVPEIASRHHLKNINRVLEEALIEANVELKDVDLIGVTCGPGLVGALLIGIATAKAISYTHNIPLVGVNHIQGHICANYIQYKELEPPFLALIVSGGHTTLAKVEDYNKFQLLGRTRDDAVGEAFDKVARVLGLGYPGGPLIDQVAKTGDASAVFFKRVYLEKGSRDFSFSGIKTAVLNYLNAAKMKEEHIHVPDVAAAFQEAVMEVLVNKTLTTAKEEKLQKLALAGGVAANSRLRELMEEQCKKSGIELYYPDKILCTDNAAMIATAAYYNFKNEEQSNLYLDAYPNLSF